MWESTGLGSEDLLWAGVPFMGGIAGQREAVCGAISASAIYLGLSHRVPLSDKSLAEQARLVAREDTRRIIASFKQEFGTIICQELLGIDFNDQVAVQRFQDSGQWREKCDRITRFVIEKLYEMETK